MAGYSGTPLLKKLGIRPHSSLLVIGEPENYFNMLGELPPGVKRVTRNNARADFIHLFVTSGHELQKKLWKLKLCRHSDGMLWVSWQKKSSGIPTDVTEDLIRAAALNLGLVDVKVCAVNEQWSGLKLVIRKENRNK